MMTKMGEDFHSVCPHETTRLDEDRCFYNLRFLTEGRKAKIYAAKHHNYDDFIILKCVLQDRTKKDDFLREFHYSFYLSPHPNIVNSFDVAFSTSKFFVFAQELAPEGDLSLDPTTQNGFGEVKTKLIIEQITFALEYVHIKDLVYRDICLQNIYAYSKDLKTVKLGDFGMTRKNGTLLKKTGIRSQWAPPEVCQASKKDGYYVHRSQDVWQMGILIFVCLTGAYPWRTAEMSDEHYASWITWLKRKTNKIPSRFKCFSPRLLILFRHLLEPVPNQRAENKEVYKYLADPWLLMETNHQDVNIDYSSANIFVKSYKFSERLVKKKLIDFLLSYTVKKIKDKTVTPKPRRSISMIEI
ncbi:unnamed protein product [Meganyctiphanes norvegica]|uniref:Protein kinase domain-containing protein n=1 Tax=Meganyctiphanes norvegica TaxID=48144 RepID=A0AAV2RYF5_MEGNR